MVNSILLNKLLFQLLSNDERLKDFVENRIYPLVADQSTKYPFIVMQRNGISTTFNKERFYQDSVSYSIMVVTNSYSDSVEIANEVRRICEIKDLKLDNMRICDSHLTNITESFFDDAYIQSLTFSANIF